MLKIMFYKLSLFILFYIFKISNCEYSSVILWDSSSPLKPNFEKISSPDFANLISTDVYDAMILVFADDELNIKDLSSCKINSNEICFSKLSKKDNKIFYAYIEDPIETLRRFNLKEEHFVISENDVDPDIKTNYEKSKLVFITFTEPINQEQKAESFVNRDYLMDKVYEKLSKNGRVVGIYTGKRSSKQLKRTVRQTSLQQNTTSGYAFNIENKFLIYINKLSYKKGSTDAVVINITSATLSQNNENPESFIIELTGDNHKIKFNISEKRGYWQLNDTTIDNISLQMNSVVNAASNFSFYCGNLTMINKENEITLTWYDLQMEPKFKNTGNQDFKFSDPWHCTGFTSPAILSGIFITFLMLAILSIGITWLMDIRTMDRFDDPKGKTITINTSE